MATSLFLGCGSPLTEELSSRRTNCQILIGQSLSVTPKFPLRPASIPEVDYDVDVQLLGALIRFCLAGVSLTGIPTRSPHVASGRGFFVKPLSEAA